MNRHSPLAAIAVAERLPLGPPPTRPAKYTESAARKDLSVAAGTGGASADLTEMPPPDIARRILENGARDFAEKMQPTTAAEAVELAVVAADPGKAIDDFIAHRATDLAPGQQPDDEEPFVFSIGAQAEIIVSATTADEIEIEQKSPMGDDEDQRIFVRPSNAVRLARNILIAAGFTGILIATEMPGGGYEDLNDGAEPYQFKKKGGTP